MTASTTPQPIPDREVAQTLRRIAALKALAKLATETAEQQQALIADRLDDGTWTMGNEWGRVTITQPKPKWKIDDPQAYAHWLKTHGYKELFVEHRTIKLSETASDPAFIETITQNGQTPDGISLTIPRRRITITPGTAILTHAGGIPQVARQLGR